MGHQPTIAMGHVHHVQWPDSPSLRPFSKRQCRQVLMAKKADPSIENAYRWSEGCVDMGLWHGYNLRWPVGLWDLKSNKLGYGPPAMVKYFRWSCNPTVCVQDTLVRLFRKDAFAIAKDDEIRDVLKCIDAPAEAWTRDERALKKHDKTNTQIAQNSHTLLGIACSVPKWSHCDGGNYRCDDPFHESVRNHETAKPSWDTARGRKESKELSVNIISYHIIYIYHTISDRHRVDQILRAAYVTQTSVAKLSGAEDAESEKPKVGDPEVRKVHFET